jgi:hypothetical protein
MSEWKPSKRTFLFVFVGFFAMSLLKNRTLEGPAIISSAGFALLYASCFIVGMWLVPDSFTDRITNLVKKLKGRAH